MLYTQKGYQINKNFQELATKQLMSGVETVDFRNRIEAVKIINNFAAKKTQNKTGDVIKPESMNSDTKILLMNTIYVNLKWENVYQPIRIEGDLTNIFTTYYPDSIAFYEGIEYVQFIGGWFKYANLSDLNAKALEIRFADSDLSLVLILPFDHNYIAFSETETKLKNYNLTRIIDQMQPQRMQVWIPTFQIKYQTSLKDLSNKVISTN